MRKFHENRSWRFREIRGTKTVRKKNNNREKETYQKRSGLPMETEDLNNREKET